jgi:hypothetical protein
VSRIRSAGQEFELTCERLVADAAVAKQSLTTVTGQAWRRLAFADFAVLFCGQLGSDNSRATGGELAELRYFVRARLVADMALAGMGSAPAEGER